MRQFKDNKCDVCGWLDGCQRHQKDKTKPRRAK
jgi:hypothetical protein